jgi:hypothetical protein
MVNDDLYDMSRAVQAVLARKNKPTTKVFTDSIKISRVRYEKVLTRLLDWKATSSGKGGGITRIHEFTDLDGVASFIDADALAAEWEDGDRKMACRVVCDASHPFVVKYNTSSMSLTMGLSFLVTDDQGQVHIGRSQELRG